MSGRDGSRGYLVQTVVSVLQALNDCSQWIRVQIEPNLPCDKVDVLWWYPTHLRAVQIKSSQNPFGRADVQRWATELSAAVSANEYELLLVGPTTHGVPKQVGKVVIPTPQSLNVRALVDQASHSLDRFLTRKRRPPTTPQVREMLIHTMVTELTLSATTGTPLERSDFERKLTLWLSHAASKGMSQRRRSAVVFQSGGVLNLRCGSVISDGGDGLRLEGGASNIDIDKMLIFNGDGVIVRGGEHNVQVSVVKNHTR